jgi:hypothetical protein
MHIANEIFHRPMMRSVIAHLSSSASSAVDDLCAFRRLLTGYFEGMTRSVTLPGAPRTLSPCSDILGVGLGDAPDHSRSSPTPEVASTR